MPFDPSDNVGHHFGSFRLVEHFVTELLVQPAFHGWTSLQREARLGRDQGIDPTVDDQGGNLEIIEM
jgi:hypothetical protein